MNFYRIFLLRQEKITAHHEFSAENDEWARRAAALAFDACADHCDDFELWYGAHLIASRAGLKTAGLKTGASVAKPDQASAEAEAASWEGAIAAVAVAIIEAAMQTSAALRDGPRVNARLSELRRAGTR